jgi:endonuclease/exonuclease/phosphatase family metal-dependent hydrolase
VKFKEEWNLLSVQKNTFPSGSGQKAVKCIDFIFALKNNAKYEVTASDVPLRFNKGNVDTASDHLPIYVDVKLK